MVRLEVMVIGPRAALVTGEVRLAGEPSGERVAEVYLTPVGIPHGGRSQ